MKMPDTLAGGRVFAYDVGRRLALEEVDVSPRDKDGKLHARLTHTITVEDGACARGNPRARSRVLTC